MMHLGLPVEEYVHLCLVADGPPTVSEEATDLARSCLQVFPSWEVVLSGIVAIVHNTTSVACPDESP